MEKLLSWLIDSSIIAGFIILIVLVIRPFIKKLPKWVNLILWLIVAVRLVMPFGLQSSFSLVPDIAGIRSGYSEILFGEQEKQDDTTPHPVAAQLPSLRQGRHQATTWLDISPQGEGFDEEGVSQTDITVPSIVATESDADITNTSPDGTEYTLGITNISLDETEHTLGITGTSVAETEYNPDTTNTVLTESEHDHGIGHILLIIWLSGCVLMLAYFVFSIIRIKRKVRFSVAANVPDDIRKESLAPVYVCEAIKTPFIMGLFGTRLYIPEGMDSSALRYVIKHENAHITHFDQVLKVLGFILLMLYWFNPLVWIGFIFFSKDIELACDERAAGRLSASDRAAYSEALLKCSVHNRMLIACPVAFGEVGVKERIKAVISIKKPVKAVIAVLIIGCFIFAICFLTNPVSAKNKDKSESNQPESEYRDNPELIEVNNSLENADAEKKHDNTEKIGNDETIGNTEQTVNIENTGNVENTDNTESEDTQVKTTIISNEKAERIDKVNPDESEKMSKVNSDKTEKINKKDNINTEPADSDVVPSEENAIIPQGIIKIKEKAFAGTNTIKTVILPDSVEVIGRAAFYDCALLEKINIPYSVKVIDSNAFQHCSGLLKVIFSEGITDIGDYAFAGSGLIRVTLPDSLKTIGKGLFSTCTRLSYCKLPEGITYIPDSAFYGCESLNEFEIPDTVKTIGISAFRYSGLKEIRIPDGVTTIDVSTFADCSELERVYLPDSITTIKNGAFSGCEKLTEINIPDSVTEISNDAFWQCNNISKETKAKIRSINKKVRFDYKK